MTWPSLSMPLVTKDLAQMSARIGTYRLRLWVAVFLVVPAIYTIVADEKGHAAALGASLASIEFTILNAAVYLLLPLIASDAIVAEKRSATLPLLVLTNMTASGIVLQKYLSRLIPMATLLLLAAPVIAVSYAYGGVSVPVIANGFLQLALAMLQVCAICMFASAMARTTTGAIVATYTTGLLFYFGPYALVNLDQATVQILDTLSGTLIIRHLGLEVLMPWISTVMSMSAGTTATPGPVAAACILLTSALFLLFAAHLVSRSMRAYAKSPARKFRSLDTIFRRADAFLGRKTDPSEPGALPDDNPVAWRVSNSLGLARRHHVVRFLLLVETPTVILLSLTAWSGASDDACWFVAIVTWVVCCLALLNQATLSFLRERNDQTLEILRTTLIDTPEIVAQHYSALRRLFFVLILPAVTVFFPLTYNRDYERLGLLVLVAVLIVMRSCMLFGLCAGAKYQNRFVALVIGVFSAVVTSLLLTMAVAIFFFSPLIGFIMGLVPAYMLLWAGKKRQLEVATYDLEHDFLRSQRSEGQSA